MLYSNPKYAYLSEVKSHWQYICSWYQDSSNFRRVKIQLTSQSSHCCYPLLLLGGVPSRVNVQLQQIGPFRLAVLFPSPVLKSQGIFTYSQVIMHVWLSFTFHGSIYFPSSAWRGCISQFLGGGVGVEPFWWCCIPLGLPFKVVWRIVASLWVNVFSSVSISIRLNAFFFLPILQVGLRLACSKATYHAQGRSRSQRSLEAQLSVSPLY